MYRIEERERQKSAALLQVGNHVAFTQHIVRVGYLFERRDMPKQECNLKAIHEFRVQFTTRLFGYGISTDVVDQIIDDALVLFSPSLVDIFWLRSYQPELQHLSWAVTGGWIDAMCEITGAQFNLRTLWYKTTPIKTGRIAKRLTRKVGVRDPGCYDEPPHLLEWGTHVLYQVRNEHGATWLIHPLDCEATE